METKAPLLQEHVVRAIIWYYSATGFSGREIEENFFFFSEKAFNFSTNRMGTGFLIFCYKLMWRGLGYLKCLFVFYSFALMKVSELKPGGPCSLVKMFSLM